LIRELMTDPPLERSESAPPIHPNRHRRRLKTGQMLGGEEFPTEA
jgi:hypothetical protein